MKKVTSKNEQAKIERTELVFILDKSGSMGGLESDTIGGYNSMLKKQQQVKGEAVVTTVLFDNAYELLHDRINIKAVKPITNEEYEVGGCTALIDAIGKTINKISRVQKNTAKEYRAKNVVFVIITDGEENASQEFTAEQVKSMIEKQKQQNNWEFIFLGANIDAVATASTFGIAEDRAQNYVADSKGTSLNFEVVSKAVASFRKTAALPKCWNEEIAADFESRN